MKRDFVRAVELAIVIGLLVAVGAWLMAPERGVVPPPVPVQGEVPPFLVYPQTPQPELICGDSCATR